LKVYSGSLNTYTETIFKTTPTFPGVEYPGGVYKDPELGYQAGVLGYLGNYIQLTDEKIRAGTATEEEKVLKETMETVSSNIIKNAMTNMAGKETDILPGSEEEKFIDAAATNMAKMTTKRVRTDLSKKIVTIQKGAGEKAVLANRLNNLIMK
jgi:hypothetical protein